MNIATPTSFTKDGKVYKLTSSSVNHFLSGRIAVKRVNLNKYMTPCAIYQIKENNGKLLPTNIQALMYSYAGLFKEPKGMPPYRAIQHSIFVLNSSLINYPAYRTTCGQHKGQEPNTAIVGKWKN